MNTRARFPELDLLRFLAACAVMLFHYTYLGPRTHVCPASLPILGEIFKYGYLGVNVFFILSGFVILLTAYEKDAIAFTIARMVRLYPAYWICVTLTAVVIVLTGTKHNPITVSEYLANLTMVHSFLGIEDVSGVYWTLAVELQFYLLIFLVLAVGQIRRTSYFLGLWLLASIVLSLRPPQGIAHFFITGKGAYHIVGRITIIVLQVIDSPFRKSFSVLLLKIITPCYPSTGQ